MNQHAVWTTEKEKTLVKLWADESMSVRKIAEALDLTPGQVAGKRYRLDLPNREVPIIRSVPKLKEPYNPASQTTSEPDASQFNPIPPLDGVHAELDAGCRWLDGEPIERDFCNREKQPGSSYCPHHHARCYEPIRNKHGS